MYVENVATIVAKVVFLISGNPLSLRRLENIILIDEIDHANVCPNCNNCLFNSNIYSLK